MKQLSVLIAMTIGFSLGNFVADQGNQSAKKSYEDFLKDIRKVQKINNPEEESEMKKQSKLLPADVDPNLVLHN